MTCFKFPKKSCKDLDRLIANFWWAGDGVSNSIHWKAWDHMLLPKEGGMGFRDFEVLNDSLLTKTAWRLQKDEEALWSGVMKGVCYPDSTFMTAKKGYKASWIWSSILTGREVLQKDCQWLIGNGKSISVWKDNWILELHGKSLKCYLNLDIESNATVSTLIDHGRWKFDSLYGVVSENILSSILNIKLEYPDQQDKMMWTKARNGSYTVKLGYKGEVMEKRRTTFRTGTPFVFPKEFWINLWKIKALPSILQFLSRCCNKAVPTR